MHHLLRARCRYAISSIIFSAANDESSITDTILFISQCYGHRRDSTLYQLWAIIIASRASLSIEDIRTRLSYIYFTHSIVVVFIWQYHDCCSSVSFFMAQIYQCITYGLADLWYLNATPLVWYFVAAYTHASNEVRYNISKSLIILSQALEPAFRYAKVIGIVAWLYMIRTYNGGITFIIKVRRAESTQNSVERREYWYGHSLINDFYACMVRLVMLRQKHSILLRRAPARYETSWQLQPPLSLIAENVENLGIVSSRAAYRHLGNFAWPFTYLNFAFVRCMPSLIRQHASMHHHCRLLCRHVLHDGLSNSIALKCWQCAIARAIIFRRVAIIYLFIFK